ncbi:guanylate kinase [Aporhodopirellula aestuarii]|uniref:Guanylate kinase n=1 Tax=Aporhodopirellula aestuarii TaxID=2950107 RepID=A0ABT0U7N7_9BACT|nr:guanylate kinase [Aporhodopirellula aestuarii]MCM2372565.1 guanylate kinase [Aporhodopirellula aestuarii]
MSLKADPETVGTSPAPGDPASSKGKLVIISGPSGSGKSTVTKRLREVCPLPLAASISATTREPRDGEVDGVDYFFLSEEEFQRRREAGEFLESKQVFSLGHWYGTLADQVATGLNAGKWVILEIDVQGALAVLEDHRYAPITIFIHPGSMTELERRLRDRGTETEVAIQARLKTAAGEMESRSVYQHQVINDTVDQAVDEICHILQIHKESTSCSKN